MKFKFTFMLSALIIITFNINSLAQNGKVVGKVTDLETGEPLIGANILISGTTMGAATDVNGYYIILNVPPNVYSIVAKYIGYKNVTNSNIEVQGNVTTEVDFKLPPQSYELGVVNVVAPKPLINKNLTNSVNIVQAEDLNNLPVRGVNSVVSTQAGVVSQGGFLYVRGGRSDEVAYYVDGVLVNNPVFGGARTLGIQNAIQEIQFQAGGYSAEYGGATSGIITTTTKIGGENYNFSFEGITDNFAKSGQQFLNTYSYGYSEYVLTASGPIAPSYNNIRFFLAGDNNFQRSPSGFYQGADFKNVYDPSLGVAADTFNFYYPMGYLVNQASNTYQAQGNVIFDYNPIKIKVGGSFERNEARDGAGITSLLAANRAGLHDANTLTGNLKFTHVLNEKAFYEVTFDYFNDYYVDEDPVFKENLPAYGDSIKNAGQGYQLKADGSNLTYLQAFGFTFAPTEIPYNGYRKQRTIHYGGKVDLLYQIGLHHEFKTGGEYTYYTIRRYSFAPFTLLLNMEASPKDPYFKIYDQLDNYGYDVFGNTTDAAGLYAPKHPVFAAYYVQDKMEFSDLVVNAGLRLDYMDPNSKTFPDLHSLPFTSLDQLDYSKMIDVKPSVQLSPRLGFSFPVTDKTVFHAQYGKFIQETQLRNLYLGYNYAAFIIKGGYAFQNPVGYGLRPERTTQYELGFKQQVGDNFAFDITGFYKDIKDQIQERLIFAETGASHGSYYGLVNGDFATTKGIEIKLDLRRVDRLSATLDYTLSDALGTGSNPNSHFNIVWQSTGTPYFPQQIAPLDFNQANKGNLNIDYRWADDDGPTILGSKWLQNLGLNVLFSFASGFNYTNYTNNSFGNAHYPTEALNASTTPWTFQIDAKLDKTFSIGSLETNIYLWVINVLNTQNVIGVFPVTGDAYDDGWLTSPQGSAKVNGLRESYGDKVAQQYEDMYKAISYDSGHFGTPRQIRLGIRLNY
jgi:CarboxypepD_reg-like domain/TonB-dependent Receptor Plug Domain